LKESAVTVLARVLRRRIGVALICALIVPATALAYSYAQEKEYSASASLLFRDPGFTQKLFGTPFFTPSSDPDREAATNLRLVSLGVVAGRTANALGGGLTRKEVAEKVDASSEGQSNVVAITATADSPRLAARLANTFAEEYISFRRDADRSKIEETLGIIRGQLAELSPAELAGTRGKELRRQKGQLELLRSLQTGNAEVVQQADLPTSPSSPRTLRNVIVGIIVGIMFGVGMAFLVDRFDRRLRDVDEVKEIFDRPILAQVPRDKSLGRREWSPDNRSPAIAETFHMLRANLRHVHSRERIDAVAICSAAAGDGKTTVAWNLAVAEAETGRNVLLIEADLRQPDLSTRLDVQRSPGLSELLAGVVEFDGAVRRVPVAPASSPAQGDYVVDVMPAGRRPPNPTDLIESEQMEDLLWRVGDMYDLVVVDTPPTTVVSDAVALLRQVSGVVVAVRLGKSTRQGAESLEQQLTYLDAQTFGVVVVNSTGKSPELYGYGYLAELPRRRGRRDDRAAKLAKASSDQAVPEWVYNRLTVTGEQAPLAEFVGRAEGTKEAENGKPVPLDFERHVPEPVGGRGSGDGWWHWNAMWPDRKGDAAEGEVVYSFASAWSLPQEWLVRASQEHPGLSFALEFVKDDAKTAGGVRWQAGALVETWSVDPDRADWVEYDESDDERSLT
jgi:tyrosine-protein kinase